MLSRHLISDCREGKPLGSEESTGKIEPLSVEMPEGMYLLYQS